MQMDASRSFFGPPFAYGLLKLINQIAQASRRCGPYAGCALEGSPGDPFSG
jgi:hypothetical protein